MNFYNLGTNQYNSFISFFWKVVSCSVNREYLSTYLNKVLIVNRYYKITHFYTFLRSTAIRAGLMLIAVIAVLGILELFFIDFEVLLNALVANHSSTIILSVFYVSETFLGLIPPEIFMAWSSKMDFPWIYLFVIATLSYLGGVTAYLIGIQLNKIDVVRNYLEVKVAKHIVNLRKWGGFFVVIGAVTPIPHSMVSMAAGIIKYSFGHYLLWALARYIRFVLYAFIIFQIF